MHHTLSNESTIKRFNTSGLKPVVLSDVRVEGDLKKMIAALYDRLEEPDYRYSSISTCCTAASCPGDWYGRTILALVLLCQVTGREPRHLDELIQCLPSHINVDGYFGQIVKDIVHDETRMASVQFLMSGLCEYYLWKQNPAILSLVERLAISLFVPLAKVVASYPDREVRTTQMQRIKREGILIGMGIGQVDDWILCSDTGILFLALDGLAQVAILTGSEGLNAAIDAMIARYTMIDVVALQAQTHATLTTARGLLRLAVHRNDASLLAFARNLYDRYRVEGMTEDYQNYNWFGRPEWTEGCAVVDSLILAGQLWQTSGEIDYLHDLHRIFFTGLRHNQFANGGFGTTCCLGSYGQALIKHHKEASWCCTMRGASGLAFAAQMSWCSDGERLVAPIAISGTVTAVLRSGKVVLRQTTDYPYGGQISIEVMNSDVYTPVTVAFYLPAGNEAGPCYLRSNGEELSWTVRAGFAEVTLPLVPGTILTMGLVIGLKVEPLQVPDRMPGHARIFHGPMMLGCDDVKNIDLGPPSSWSYQGHGTWQTQNGVALSPIWMGSYRDMEDNLMRSTRLLFPMASDRGGIGVKPDTPI